MNMIQIIPSILVPSEQVFLAQIKAVQDAVSMIQIDIADGTLVPNTTWADPDVVAERLEIDCELHLMVANPIEEARYWVDVPQVKRILVHYESRPNDIAEVLAQIHAYGWDVGIVLNPETPTEAIDDFVEEIDSVMFMGVKPGEQGQSFIPEVLEQITALKKKYPNMFMELDGGVNEDTISDIAKTGINGVCPGSAIFGNDREPKENIKRLQHIINRLTQQ